MLSGAGCGVVEHGGAARGPVEGCVCRNLALGNPDKSGSELMFRGVGKMGDFFGESDG